MKLGAWIVMVSLVVIVRLPEVPVIVSVLVPPGAEALAVNVSTLVVDVGFVPQVAVTPLGRPVTERLTAALKPYSGATVTVEVPEPPWLIDRLLGLAVRVNVGV